MKFERNSKYNTIAIYVFLTVAAIICFLACVIYHDGLFGKLRTFFKILSPFIYGFVIAYLISPIEKWIYNTLRKLFRKSNSILLFKVLSIIFSYVFVILCVTGFFLLMIPQIIESISELYQNLPAVLGKANMVLTKALEFFEQEGITIYSTDSVTSAIDEIYNFAKTYVPKLIETLTKTALGFKDFFIGLFVSVYMLAGKEKFKKQFKKLINAFFNGKTVSGIVEFFSKTNEMFGGFIKAKLFEAVIIGVLCFIGMNILRLPYASLISLIIGVTDIIPFFGPFIGAIPCAIIILTVSPIKMIWFILFVIVLQQIEGHIIGPKILGESTGLPSFWVMFSLIVMGGYFGVAGMIIAVPVFGLIYYFAKQLCDNKLAKKGMPTDTDFYE